MAKVRGFSWSSSGFRGFGGFGCARFGGLLGQRVGLMPSSAPFLPAPSAGVAGWALPLTRERFSGLAAHW